MVFVNSLSTFQNQFSSMKYHFVAFLLFITTAASYSQVLPAMIFAAPLLLSDTAQLPIHSFTIAQKNNKALLRWKSDSLPAAETFYAVERSSNGVDFNLLGITKNISGGWFEFVDDAPAKGKLFYRVKLSAGQTSYYSPVLAATPSADASCKFYPNPVDKVLIIRSELSVDIQISDAFGKPLITEKLQGGLKIIDVSALEAGIYVITLFQKETNKLVTEKLVKK
ncbi:MAG: T9SS type A sorting domain-containing protein [Chitinophagaceae bacterium]